MTNKPSNPLEEIFKPEEIRTLPEEEQKAFQIALSDYMTKVHREYILMEFLSEKKAHDILVY